MKKILFMITSLQLGGAERVLVDIVNRLKQQYDITIVTIYGNGEFIPQLDKKVKVFSLFSTSYEETPKIKRRLLSCQLLFPILTKRLYRKMVKENYDVEIAFLEGPVTWILRSSSQAKKIAWVHNDLEKVYGKGFGNWWRRHLNRKSYRRYEEIIFVSHDNRRVFEKCYPSISNEKKVIYNYIEEERIKKLALEDSVDTYFDDAKVFCVVARLTEQKGLERLISVHQQLIHDGYFHRIYVVGDGPLRLRLLELIDSFNVNNTFILLGKRNNPYPFIAKADYFLLPSYYEGYPMVVLEAKALEKTILITDTAAREVVKNYPKAIIMKNSEQGIYQGIKKVLTCKEKKEKIPKSENTSILHDIIEVIEK